MAKLPKMTLRPNTQKPKIPNSRQTLMNNSTARTGSGAGVSSVRSNVTPRTSAYGGTMQTNMERGRTARMARTGATGGTAGAAVRPTTTSTTKAPGKANVIKAPVKSAGGRTVSETPQKVTANYKEGAGNRTGSAATYQNPAVKQGNTTKKETTKATTQAKTTTTKQTTGQKESYFERKTREDQARKAAAEANKAAYREKKTREDQARLAAQQAKREEKTRQDQAKKAAAAKKKGKK